jgi:hypothetical protein
MWKAVEIAHRVAAEGIRPEQAADNAIARIGQILAEGAGSDRNQTTLFSECRDDWIDEDNLSV